ncbi:MAG TPA: cbb3-type cytochrome c oxidase subunit I, partial [Porticoccaceae bacterium]
FLVIFVCGGLTGVMLALVPFNWQVHDTHFVVAHMHYVLVGGMLFPLIAGLYYWLPHLTGRMPSERLGRWAFWLTFGGFNLTFLLMHLTGLRGMPRRVYTYEPGLGWDWLNLLSSVGGFVMAIGVALLLVDLALHGRYGRRARANPWQADTLEWATTMPASSYNFVSLPEIHSRHPLWDDPELPRTIAEGEHGLSEIDHIRRETWGTDAITARVSEVFHLPSNSWLPLQAAAALALLCISLLTRSYAIALAVTVVALVMLLRWSWHSGAHPRAEPLSTEERTDPPLHSRTLDGPGRWGMITTLMANGTLYASLLFGWLYLWTVAPHWQVPAQSPLSGVMLAASGILLTAAALGHRHWCRRLARGHDRGLHSGMWLVATTGAAHFVLLVWVCIMAPLTPQALAHDAVLTVMLIYLLLHSGLAVLLTAMQAVRVRLGYIAAHLPYEPQVLQPWWMYTAGVFWLGYGAFVLLPKAFGAVAGGLG